MIKVKQTNNTGTWFLLTMFLIFMTLKLTGHITWSWWIVSAPLWGPITVVLGIWLVALLIGLCVYVIKRIFN